MKQNHVRAKLKRGEPSVGTWLTLPDPTAALLMAQAGFDWLTVELEHTPVTFQTAAQSFAIVAASGCVPLARVPWNTGENIKRVLDTGAWGIVVPMVNSRAEAEAAVAAARYAPLGARSIGGALHAADFEKDGGPYYPPAHHENLLVLLAPTPPPLQTAHALLPGPPLAVVF